MFYFVPVLLAFSSAAQTTDTPAELVKKLAGDDPQPAVTALLAVDPAESLPLLVDCLKVAPPAHAWQAGMVIDQLALAQPKHKAWKQTATGLSKIVLDTEAEETNRTISALSMRHLGRAAKPSYKRLGELIDSEEPITVRFGVSLAFAGFGKDSVSTLKKHLRSEGMMKALLTSIALAGMGKDGSSTKRALAALLEDEKSMTAYLTCRSLAFTLEQVAGSKVAAKPWSHRRAILSGRMWRGGYHGLNFGGLMPPDVRMFVRNVMAEVKKPVANVSKMSLPDSFPDPLGSMFNLGEGTICLGDHFTRETVQLRASMEAGELLAWHDWSNAADPLLELGKLLDMLDYYSKP